MNPSICQLQRLFQLHHIDTRHLDGDVVICCFVSAKPVESTRITCIDLMQLEEVLRRINREQNILACSIVATAERNEKIICVVYDPHWHLKGKLSHLLTPDIHIKTSDTAHVRSIHDAIRNGFAKNGLNVSVTTEEEAFDDTGAICFMDVIFSDESNCLAFDLKQCMESISYQLTSMKLNLLHFKLFDLHGQWNHMRVCLSVEKRPEKINFIGHNRENNMGSEEAVPIITRKDGNRQASRRGLFLLWLLSIAFTTLTFGLLRYGKEGILYLFF